MASLSISLLCIISCYLKSGHFILVVLENRWQHILLLSFNGYHLPQYIYSIYLYLVVLSINLIISYRSKLKIFLAVNTLCKQCKKNLCQCISEPTWKFSCQYKSEHTFSLITLWFPTQELTGSAMGIVCWEQPS